MNRFLYHLIAKNEYSLHSPFVFNYYTKVVRNRYCFPVYNEIEKISKPSLSQRKIGEFLFRTADYFQSKEILEIGDTPSVSSAFYLSAANSNAHVTVFNSLSCISLNKIQTKIGFQNISLHTTDTEEALKDKLKNHQNIDLVFFNKGLTDAGKIQEYFELISPNLSKKSILILEAPHASKAKQRAWENLKKHPTVRVSMDLFSVGILFMHSELSKQDFILRF